MNVRDRVESALAALRPGFEADGADLEVVEAEPGRVVVRLVALDETCWECVVAPPILRSIIEAAVREALPAVGTVVLDDPREAPGNGSRFGS